MIMRVSLSIVFVLGMLLLGIPAWAQPQPTTSVAWTLDEALSQLQLYPKDPYLQFVTLQLARQENRVAEIAAEVQQAIGRPARRTGRGNDVDLFGIFSGALAVQESLQLDTMVGDEVAGPAVGQVERDARPDDAGRGSQAAPQGPVSLAGLQGPTVKSHPWNEMLEGRTPELSTLADCVPDDFYYIRFRSVDKLLSVLDSSDMWATHIFSQTVHKAYSHLSHERIKRQLAVEVSALVRPFYDLAVQEVVVVGSDLFAIEGSDVSLLFNLSQPPLFKAQMDAFLVKAESSSADVTRTTGVYRDIPFVHLTCPDRSIHVFSAYPKDSIHVRSNSRVAFERILDAITSSGEKVDTLGTSDEIRLYPHVDAPGSGTGRRFRLPVRPVHSSHGESTTETHRAAATSVQQSLAHDRARGCVASDPIRQTGRIARRVNSFRLCAGQLRTGRLDLPLPGDLLPFRKRTHRRVLASRPPGSHGALLRNPVNGGVADRGTGLPGI